MKKLSVFISAVTLSSALYAQTTSNIIVYAGPGAGQNSISNTISMLRQLVDTEYKVIAVGPEYILDPAWIDNTALLIMPGGADRPYVAKLNGQGNQNIKRYIEQGGKFLGICAGAYYAADRIEFAKGDLDLEVSGERELKLFPGLVEGPTYTGFDHRNVQTYKGVRAAKISWNFTQAGPFKLGQELSVFYYGGGHFVQTQAYPNITVLARYVPEHNEAKDCPAAIVACTVGNGRAILSGVHFEWDPQTLDLQSTELSKIKPSLVAGNMDRIILAKFILSYLDVKLSN